MLSESEIAAQIIVNGMSQYSIKVGAAAQSSLAIIGLVYASQWKPITEERTSAR